MPDLVLPSLADLVDLTPVLWAAGGTMLLFALCVVALLPFALFGRGHVGENARWLLCRLFGLFHALLEVFKNRGGRR